jgi:hypothetical protein
VPAVFETLLICIITVSLYNNSSSIEFHTASAVSAVSRITLVHVFWNISANLKPNYKFGVCLCGTFGSIHKKTRGRKSRASVPLKEHFCKISYSCFFIEQLSLQNIFSQVSDFAQLLPIYCRLAVNTIEFNMCILYIQSIQPCR